MLIRKNVGVGLITIFVCLLLILVACSDNAVPQEQSDDRVAIGDGITIEHVILVGESVQLEGVIITAEQIWLIDSSDSEDTLDEDSIVVGLAFTIENTSDAIVNIDTLLDVSATVNGVEASRIIPYSGGSVVSIQPRTQEYGNARFKLPVDAQTFTVAFGGGLLYSTATFELNIP